jgi:hypothetical protein
MRLFVDLNGPPNKINIQDPIIGIVSMEHIRGLKALRDQRTVVGSFLPFHSGGPEG